MFEPITLIALAALSTAVASALHGGNYISKGYVVAGHLLCSPAVAAIYWIAFRRGKQAKAELDYIDGRVNADAIVAAYYVRPLGVLMRRLIVRAYCNPWPHLKADSSGMRIQQEITTGFVLGGILGGVVYSVKLLVGAL